jgi:hypothetical protein
VFVSAPQLPSAHLGEGKRADSYKLQTGLINQNSEGKLPYTEIIERILKQSHLRHCDQRHFDKHLRSMSFIAELLLGSVKSAQHQSVSLSQPLQLGSFAIQGGEHFEGGAEFLVRSFALFIEDLPDKDTKRKFSQPEVPLDLNPGYETRITKNIDEDGDLGPFLRHLRDSNADVRVVTRLLRFFCLTMNLRQSFQISTWFRLEIT